MVIIIASLGCSWHPDDVTLGPNPNPARIAAASWWFMGELVLLDPGTTNGGIWVDKPGYHGTRDENRARNGWDDYSVRDAEDRLGPSDKSAGYDWIFPEAQHGDYRRMAARGRYVKAAYLSLDPRLTGWREFLGQTDTDTPPEGLDFRYHRERVPDSTHSWHDHFSEDRGLVESFDNKRAMLSILRGETVAQWLTQEGIMILVAEDGDPRAWIADGVWRRWIENPAELALIQNAAALGHIPLFSRTVQKVKSVQAYGRDVATATAVKLDEATVGAIVSGILAGMPPAPGINGATVAAALNSLQFNASPRV